ALAQRERRVHAAGVELDALPDAIGPRAEDHHFAAARRRGLVLALVGGGEGRRQRFELGSAGVDALVDGAGAELAAPGPRPVLSRPDLFVAEAVLLPNLQPRRGRIVAGGANLPFHLHDLGDLAQEPRIDRGELINLLDAHADAEGVADGEDALGARRAEVFDDVIAVVAARLEAADADLERAQPLLQRLVEGAADGHRLAHRLHRQSEHRQR